MGYATRSWLISQAWSTTLSLSRSDQRCRPIEEEPNLRQIRRKPMTAAPPYDQLSLHLGLLAVDGKHAIVGVVDEERIVIQRTEVHLVMNAVGGKGTDSHDVGQHLVAAVECERRAAAVRA